jgi:hypothetical protein
MQTHLKPQVCLYYDFLCTLLMIIRRRLLRLPPATTISNATPPHVPRTHPRCKHESVGRFYIPNPTLAPNASRWGYLLNLSVTTHPGPHPRSKSESVESFFGTIHATTHLDPTLAPKASRWGYFLNPFT